MEFGWQQVWAIGVILVGVYWIVKRNVPVGLENRPPWFFAKGKYAVLLGILAIVFGFVVALDLPKQLRIDKCLDSGGQYNYEKDECVQN